MRKLLIAILIFGFCFYGGSELSAFEIKATSIDPPTENREEESQREKIVYLTFDDGPSRATDKILDILKKYDIKATFFVIGTSIESNPNTFKRTIDEGHSVCIHTYTHNKNIYNDVESFFKDNERCRELLEEKMYRGTNKYFRFPGGSSNRMGNKTTLKEIRQEAFNRELCYVDWNMSLEDSIYKNTPSSTLLRTFKKQYKNQDRIVILMHDAHYNMTTAEALPVIIKFLKHEGYEFSDFGNISEDEYVKLKRMRLINKYEVE
ncbi:polysaccharide deacetylase family protein [Clostridium cellulovorans]|uniref:Polysaccharide deacetylase n=2 Tax=Clostridium cellulovorans TaxID=1493 RepID=D9SSU1_CLOC7|nr:polysaccharide deacetylase family protein [Clostridium cellulovorans]ADL52603.1 polysaccharide deacetylase [Clostridium cellulovorans 743B]BAV13100.1 peptidoglycan N-acetylglucosamine deacetylase [Clostridium cellulovorans]